LPPIEVLCDVDSPLTGLSGSAHVFGPQKGATPQMVLELDKGLGNLARIVRTQFGKEIETVAGSGAAGGLAAGAIAFMNAALIPGIDTVIKASNLSAAIEDADWLITGEGSFDAQSLRGKVVAGVAKTAMKKGVRVVVLAGQVKLAPAQYLPCGIVDAFACRKPEMTLDYALDHAPQLLADAAAEFAARYLGDNKH
jgi:glycerate kinase